MRASTPISISTALLIGSTLASCNEYPQDVTACIHKPPINATTDNYPGSKATHQKTKYPYDISGLADVPVAGSACRSEDPAEELACARKYIDAIDEQLGFLYARRLGYAAIAGAAKFKNGTSLNDPTRNQAVAAGMAARVAKYGGSKETGEIMGGEGCQIYASLEYEAQQIRKCGGKVHETFERVCK
ncbi:Chorismate mutase, type II [Fusarium austroafricanum]|uniref:Chorismate mutase, type II n=1 Tax=Fusarium austroafricanum TaxID=2364996 RepID=A0A8H4KQB1_9HYPO|nr:Chorismate mutase, type II [Fusarium austroafricanum]